MHCKYNLIDKNKLTCISPTLRKLEIQCVSSAHYQRWAFRICPHKAILSGSLFSRPFPFSDSPYLSTVSEVCVRVFPGFPRWESQTHPFHFTEQPWVWSGTSGLQSIYAKICPAFLVLLEALVHKLSWKRLAQNLRFSAWIRGNCWTGLYRVCEIGGLTKRESVSKDGVFPLPGL